jgi:hypothetical protein
MWSKARNLFDLGGLAVGPFLEPLLLEPKVGELPGANGG